MRLGIRNRKPLFEHPESAVTEALGLVPVRLGVSKEAILTAPWLGANGRKNALGLRQIVGPVGIWLQVEAT